MTRHPFRWSSLVFGLLFLAGVGQWAVWKQDWLTPRELSLASSGVLIGLGLLGVVATFWKPKQLTSTPNLEENSSSERSENEEADTQS
ncbi:hypothetical protein J2X11_002532 [Aeromicrobium panaciterrae]|uniref:Uncharacterized protein n=1 Tax=Aeromicrobium panaciterrae TaxID=363861 RepID=A0ABU1UR66_9ACTN|nr:hypothetical protein [Aeromicrobium panaciterrae]MDR7087693.1 hypothetical protein [Aeromicrobium panaciterrae]